MPFWFRAALLWLLVVALPVQGWAAATMLNCGPSHHQMAVESAVPHSVPHTPDVGHDLMETPSGHSHTGHSHEHPAAAVASATDVAKGEPAGTDHPLQKLGEFKCSACASCCLGVGLPSQEVSFEAGVSSDTPVARLHQTVAVFLTDGLERPPRPLRA